MKGNFFLSIETSIIVYLENKATNRRRYCAFGISWSYMALTTMSDMKKISGACIIMWSYLIRYILT